VRIVVWVRGEQDATTAAGLAERLANAAALGHGDVVVDLSEVPFVDRAIVKVLVHSQELLESQCRRLALRAPSTFVQRVLDVCGLVDLVEGDPAVGGLCPRTRAERDCRRDRAAKRRSRPRRVVHDRRRRTGAAPSPALGAESNFARRRSSSCRAAGHGVWTWIS